MERCCYESEVAGPCPVARAAAGVIENWQKVGAPCLLAGEIVFDRSQYVVE